MYLSSFERKKEILAYLKSIPHVTNFIEAIGSWDIEFDLEVQSNKEYHDLMFELKEKYEEISEIQFFRAPRIYKVIDMPC